MFFSQDTVRSTMMTRLAKSDQITMSGRSRVYMMWFRKWGASFRSAVISPLSCGCEELLTFLVCWHVEVGPHLLGGRWCMVWGLGWAARLPPCIVFLLAPPVWWAPGDSGRCTSMVNSHRTKEHNTGSFLQTCTSRRYHLMWSPTACG